MGSLSYLEGRLNKMYEETRGKLRERRRQDVRDQADILAAQAATAFSLNMDLVQDAIRDFRVAEREGRQRRRRQARQSKVPVPTYLRNTTIFSNFLQIC